MVTNNQIRYQKHKYKQKQRYELKRKIVVWHYSCGTFKCICCGEWRYEFLTINHIERIRRKVPSSKYSGYALITKLLRENLPKGFNIMCQNCNASYGQRGYCPHEF